MAERVFVSRRDEGDRGRDSIQKGRGSGSSRAVVADFEDVGMQIFARSQKSGLDTALHIAGQQEGSRAVADPKHQGVVIPYFASHVIVCGRQNFEDRAGELMRAGGMLLKRGNAQAPSLFK